MPPKDQSPITSERPDLDLLIMGWTNVAWKGYRVPLVSDDHCQQELKTTLCINIDDTKICVGVGRHTLHNEHCFVYLGGGALVTLRCSEQWTAVDSCWGDKL